ncbi:hypothetical protein NEHOM01_2454, partial [Nematocida homosporus]|uniref:uncharacterized protein n=1 Tax=Nematocida homosporus TaxID=1912981 RepID=UPI002220D3C2
KTLILDNVDETIIYRIFSRYIFADQIEIHILNQYFQNLAIAQILSLPIARPISRLVLNDFAELNEVRYYRKPDTNKGFSLFKYIKEFKDKSEEDDEDKGDEDKNKNTNDETGSLKQDLGLHKLCLLVSKAENSSYSSVLTELTSHGIHSVIGPNKLSRISVAALFSRAIMTRTSHLQISGITLEILNPYLATNRSLSQPNTELNQALQPQQSPSDGKPVTKLSLYFTRSQTITITDLLNILRWLAYQFVDLTILTLANLKMTEDTRRLIASSDYLIDGLPKLRKAQIILTNPDIPPISLIVRPYYDSFLIKHPNPRFKFTAIAIPLLLTLIGNLDKLSTLIPKEASSNAPLQLIINHIKGPNPELTCTICMRSLYKSPKEGDRVESEITGPDDTPDPMNSFIALCYSPCRHKLCNDCVYGIEEALDNGCPFCRYASKGKSIYRLTSAPLSSFVFAEGSTQSLTTHDEWLKSMAWNDGQIYLYLPYNSISDLTAKIHSEQANQNTHQTYIILP